MTEIRPDYYKSGGLESFDVIDAFDLDFNLGNAFKYIARAGKKGDKTEDLRKAVTYLNREIEKGKKENIGSIKGLDDLEDGKKYYLKSLLSGIDENYNYMNLMDGSNGYILSNDKIESAYQTEFNKDEIKHLVRHWHVDLDDFEIVEVESDYEAGRQENL